MCKVRELFDREYRIHKWLGKHYTETKMFILDVRATVEEAHRIQKDDNTPSNNRRRAD